MTTTNYVITFARPSRSKCPNAYARVQGSDSWLRDSATVPFGAIIEIGGDVRRATRTERIRETVTIDGEVGSWSAWGGAGSITISEAQ